MSAPLVEQFRRGGISRDVRMTAASGLLPLKPADHVELLYLLTIDRDEEVRERAKESLVAIPGAKLLPVLSDRSMNPKVLDFFASHVQATEQLQAILQNPATEDRTVGSMVSRLPEELLELVVINQTRLLRMPTIIPVLEAHPRLNSDQRRRLGELKHDFKLEKPPAPPPEPPPAEALMDLGEGPAEQEEPPARAEEAQEAYVKGEGEGVIPEDEQRKRESAFQKISRMTPPEKMIEALTGDRESRMLLVRERNRAVYAAVLSSPKLTPVEVEAFASMRNVSPEVLRAIGGHREWTRQYVVAHELVRNPKTPIEISMRLISRLAARDLKRLTRDRNVAEPIRRQATKMTRKEK